MIYRAEHWRIRRLKESVLMLGYNDLLSRPSIELNMGTELSRPSIELNMGTDN